MKVQQLIDQLSFIPPNYDVMVKVGDSERDLITKIGSINCVNSKINPPSGFIELETCNAIDWLRAFYNEAIPKTDYEIRLKADMVAMLYKLRSEIINMPKYFPYEDHTRWFIDGDVFGLIDKKINTLKGNDNGLDEKTSD